jgi:fumarate reductase flavoprotein subunit
MENKKCEVVVVGTGGAGMCAAVSAAKSGASVIVFEKAIFPGGTTNMASGIFVAEGNTQSGVAYPRDEHFRLFMNYIHWRANARLVKAYINKSVSTYEWLKDLGIEFEAGRYFQDSFYTVYRIKGLDRGHGGSILVQTLINKANEYGTQIHLDMRVKKIIRNAGIVKGVIVEDNNGKAIQVNSQAVIIATGGFPANKEMLKRYTGFDLGRNLIMLLNLKLTGDGIQMAWEAGASSGPMGPHLAGKNIPGPGIEGTRPWIVKNQLRIVEGQPYLWVNQEGERFIDEGIVNINPYLSNALALQKNKCAYVIIDGNTKTYMEKEGVDYEWDVWPGKKIVDLDCQIQQCLNEGNENVFVANSLNELSHKMRVNSDILLKTINEYNSYCAKGHDDLFGKNPKFLQPVKQPLFYAFKVLPIAYGTLGGIKINEKTEVLDEEDEAIPGLFAAGNDACGIFGDLPNYDYIHMMGGTFGFAVNSGRIAGENALRYIGK